MKIINIILPPLMLPIHCFFLLLFRRWLGSFGTFYASIFSFSLLIVIIFLTLTKIFLTGVYLYVDYGRWFSCLDFIDSHFLLCGDTLANLSALLVAFLTPISLYFGLEYMVREAFANRLLYLLNLFAASVILLFFSYDFFLIILFWECVGLFSLLLVNFYSQRIYTLKAAFKTFIFSRISDMFLFTAFLFSVNTFNSCDLSLIFIQIPFFSLHYIFFGYVGFHFLTFLAFLISLGGVIKCAQFGFHVWLPDAMEAPTPASALIHSSTLVIAGVFLILRFALLFEFTPSVNLFLALLGSLTLAFSAITASFQQDIKKLVAFSTISQIGYLICGCGFTLYEETLLYLVVHALNKAFLFVLVGYLVHFYNGNTDLRFMGNSYFLSFDIAVIMLILGANLSGLPYFAGFIGKEFLILQMGVGDSICLIIRAFWLIAFIFTPIYMLMLVFNVVFGPIRGASSVYSTFTFFVKYEKNEIGINGSGMKFVLNYITANLTTIFSFILIIFISSFGEGLVLTILNYNLLGDLINANSWTLHQNKFSLTLLLFSYQTLFHITNFIFIAAVCALLFLETLNTTQIETLLSSNLMKAILIIFIWLTLIVNAPISLCLSYGCFLFICKVYKNV